MMQLLIWMIFSPSLCGSVAAVSRAVLDNMILVFAVTLSVGADAAAAAAAVSSDNLYV